MQKLAHFVAAFPHHFKPLVGDGSQFASVLFHPSIDGGGMFNRAVKSQKV